jgi:hypothetical protein
MNNLSLSNLTRRKIIMAMIMIMKNMIQTTQVL